MSSDLSKHLESCLSPVNIYWIKRNNKKVLLSSRGRIINYQVIKKIPIDSLFFESVIDNENTDENIHALSLFINSLKNEKLEYEKVRAQKKWLQSSKSYLIGLNEFCVVECANLLFEHFFIFDEKEKEELIALGDVFFIRHVKLASTMILSLMAMGYLDFKLLKNVYNCIFLLDSYNFKSALSLQSFETLLAKNKHQNIDSERDQALVKELTRSSLNITAEKYSHYFSNSIIYKLLELNFKDLNDDKSTFINGNIYSDLDQIFCMLTSYFSYNLDDHPEVYSSFYKTIPERLECFALKRLIHQFEETSFDDYVSRGSSEVAS